MVGQIQPKDTNHERNKSLEGYHQQTKRDIKSKQKQKRKYDDETTRKTERCADYEQNAQPQTKNLAVNSKTHTLHKNI